MPTYVALLRAINVSGQNAVPMPALRESLADLGFNDVRTHLQSGNIVFDARRSDKEVIAAAIKTCIARHFRLDIPVLVMSARELRAVAGANPLWPRTGGDEKLFHATFLFQPVSLQSLQALKLPAAVGERALLVKQAILLHCPYGYGRTKLNNDYFERALGVPATTRNWRTVLALQELCGAL